MKEFAGKTGQSALFILSGVARLWNLGSAVAGYTFSAFFKKKVIPKEALFRQMVLIGIDSTGSWCGVCIGSVGKLG